MDTDTSDSALLQAWQRHRDAEAFHAIVGRHGRLVYNTCRHILRNDTDAADVSQECFLSLASTPPSIRYSLSGWLHRLATHRSLDHLKAAKRRREREVRYAGEAVVAGSDEQADLMALVDEAIDALPDDLRLPLIEHFLRQKSHQEVADGLGIPRRTVTYRINSGVEELRERLKRKGVAVPGAGLVLALEAQDAGAAEVPARIYEALGRHALAGASPGAIPSVGTGLTAAVLMKKGWIAAAVLVGLALAWGLAAGGNFLKSPGSTPTPVALDHDSDSQSATAEKEVAQGVVENVLDDTLTATEQLADETVGVGKISGRVYDEDSQAPIPDATIVVASSGGSSKSVYATTDAAGRYETPKLPARAYVVYRDETPGYAPTPRTGVGKKSTEPSHINGTHVTLSGDATVDFAVRKGLIVAGTVLDKRERGIEGAEVMASVFGSEFAQSTSTDAEGRFSLSGFTPSANLHVRVKKQGYGEAALSNLRLVMPGAEDLEIHLTNAASISGTVVDPHGHPLEGARNIASHLGNYGGWSFDYPEGTSGDGGVFTVVDLAPGRYNLQAIPREYESYSSSGPVSMTLSEGEHRRDVRLDVEGGDGIEIAGSVTDKENRPLESVKITVIGTSSRSVASDAQGNFRIGGLLEGEYMILPLKQGYREHGKTEMSLDYSIRASRDDLHIVLEKFALRVEGIVRDAETNEPLSGFEVAAQTGFDVDPVINSNVWFQASHFANVDGSFAVDAEVPWRFEVGLEGPVCAVYVRKVGYAPKMMIVPPAADRDTVYAEVELDRGRSVEGTVADQFGAPVAGAIIAEGQLYADTVSRRTDLALSDEDGRFVVVGLREGVDALTAIHPAYPLASAMIGDAARPLRIVFGPSGEIQGTIYMDGVPSPLTDISVESRGTESTYGAYGATDPAGKFRFGPLAPGEYDLTTGHTDNSRRDGIIIQQAVVHPGLSTTVDFNLTSETVLQGTIKINGATPAWGRVKFDIESNELSAGHMPHVNADGSWHIDNVTPGFGTLTVEAGVTDGETLRRTIEIELAPGEERVFDVDLSEEEESRTEE